MITKAKSLLFFLPMLGCSNPDTTPTTIAVEQLEFGIYREIRFLDGANTHMFRLTRDSLYADTLDISPFPVRSPYEGLYVPLDAGLHHHVKHLLDEVPYGLLNEPSGVLGADCHLTERIFSYIAFEYGGSRRYWIIQCNFNDDYKPFIHSVGEELGWLSPN